MKHNAGDILGTIPVPILIVDRGGQIRFANAAAAAMFGYTIDELTDLPVHLLVPDALRQGHARRCARYADEPAARAMSADEPVRALRSSGVLFPISVHLGPVGAGEDLQVVCTIRDLTEPAAAAEGAAALAATNPHVLRPTVLFVEDDHAVLAAMLMTFEMDDIDARGAESGAAALRLVSEGFRPDVIVSDLRLGGEEGPEVIARLRQAMGVETPAILLTGDVRMSAARLGGLTDCQVVHKPFDADVLARHICALAGFPETG